MTSTTATPRDSEGISVARLRPEHHRAVCQLSARMEGFSKLTPYILWMATRLLPEFQLVALRGGRVHAYCVALPFSQSTDLFVWQVGIDAKAIADGSHLVLLEAIRNAARRTGALRILFTLLPDREWVLNGIEEVFGRSATLVADDDPPSDNEVLMEIKL